MKIKLTPDFVLKAGVETGKDRSIYWDMGLEGFGLMVLASGRRSYVVQYRNAKGMSRRMTLRSVLKLPAARKEAMGILSAAAKGADPLAERRKAAEKGVTALRIVGDQYLAREGKGLRSIDQRRDHLERLVYPVLGQKQIGDIRRSDITRLLDKIEDRNGPVMADAVLATVRRLFSWHAGRSDDFRSPIVRGMARSKPKERQRRRVLGDDELRAVWRHAEAGRSAFDYMLRFILLTANRRTEAANMRRQEAAGVDWIIPAARHKSKKDFLLPLSSAAIDLLSSVPVIGRRGLVFTTDGKTPISGFSKFKKAFDLRCGVSDWTIHDLRRTARSLMSRAGADPDHAERAMGHIITGIRGTYDIHAYRDEKLAVFEALAQQIQAIINPTVSA
jgi:integrase